jgi:hypothetical protein
MPTEKRMENSQNVSGEKYTGLIPALLRNTESAPKQEANWRPGTVSYVATPAPAPAPTYAATPTPTVPRKEPTTQKEPTPAKETGYQKLPRTASVSPPSAPSVPTPATTEVEWLSVPKLLSVLKDSDTPAQREWAADCLAGADCKAHPEIIPAVLNAAKADASASVRIASIRTLAKVHAGGPDVIVGLNSLTSDSDANVRKEANQAVSQLVGNGTASGIQPAGALQPARPR